MSTQRYIRGQRALGIYGASRLSRPPQRLAEPDIKPLAITIAEFPTDANSISAGTNSVIANNNWGGRPPIFTFRSMATMFDFIEPITGAHPGDPMTVGAGVEIWLVSWDLVSDPSITSPDVVQVVPVAPGSGSASASWSGAYVLPDYGNNNNGFSYVVHNGSGVDIAVGSGFVRYGYTTS